MTVDPTALKALQECAAPFRIGNQDGIISREELFREFNRRQKIATAALQAAQPAAGDVVEQLRALYPDLSQLLNGFADDGRYWSEWDESVRQRLIKWGAAVESDHAALAAIKEPGT